MTSVAVRPARFPRDAATVSALVGSYLRQTEDEKAERGLAPADVPLPDRYAREIADPAAVFADRRVLLASVDDIDCGVVVVTPSATGTELSRFWTAPHVRGRGVGSALLGAALDGAVRPVRLSVWEWRDAALRLYRAAGFVAVPSWDDRPGLICLERS